MQTTPEPGALANRRRDGANATRVWWVLVVVSGCAALVAFVLVLVSTGLNSAVIAADPSCAGSFAPGPAHRLQLVDNLNHSLVVAGAAGLLSWFCAFASRRSRSGSTTGARRTVSTLLILFSSLAVVSLVCSVCGYAFDSPCAF